MHHALGQRALVGLKRKSVVGGGDAIPAIATALRVARKKRQISHEVDMRVTNRKTEWFVEGGT